MQIERIKYPELHNGDIIRIKAAKGSTINKENVLESRPHTNILKFMNDSKIDQNLSKAILDTDLDIVIRDKEEPLRPIYVTQNDINPWNHLKRTPLIDLFFSKENNSKKSDKEEMSDSRSNSESDSLRNEENNYDRSFDFDNPDDKLGPRYLIDFNVLAYTPTDIKEFVQGFWDSCKMTYGS